MFASKDLFFTNSGGYKIQRSVRTRASASAYFGRTPGSASNRTTWTWSAWVKRGVIPIGSSAAGSGLFGAGTLGNNANFRALLFDAGVGTNTACIYLQETVQNVSNQFIWYSTAVFRDPSAWYHIIVAMDTTQATAANRIKVYVNNFLISGTYNVNLSQNQALSINNNVAQYIAASPNNSSALDYLDGYLTEINFIDGQQLTPSSFGQTNPVTGVWQPIKYTGTYGTNGYYLNFSDNSNNTATTIGKDNSGNGNNWTPNNISVTAGTTYDSMLDSPTPYADGGNGRGNYCVLNPLYIAGGGTFSNGNLQVATGTSTAGRAISTMGILSGKWYWEITPTSIPAGGVSIGVVPIPTTNDSGTVGNNASEYGYLSGGNKFNNSTSTAYGASYIANDVIGIALDLDGGTITFYKNNTSQGTAFSSITTTTYIPAVSDTSSSDTATLVANFGQRPFSYTPPTGFVALNTQNLPTPTISNGATVMAASLYTGTGSALSVSNAVNGVSFQPDWVWIKSRSNITSHGLFDANRGVRDVLQSNATSAEAVETAGTSLTSFDSGGFSLGTNGSSVSTNVSGYTFVGWQWKAGGTPVSNTNGSITSTVSVGATQGFSVVTFTCTGSNATVGHGLGVAPKMIITKFRGGVNSWWTYHASLATPATQQLALNTTAAVNTDATFWNSTNPTSSVFSIGTAFTPATTMVAYCFSAVAGYSAFGSYTGNGSTDGPFVYCGFRPRYVMTKRTDSTGDWAVYDTSRDVANVASLELYPDSSSAEVNTARLDILSNGFKLRNAGAFQNANGGTYIFMAFAENPFKISLAR